jgi:DNA-binding response OmpR family regulator
MQGSELIRRAKIARPDIICILCSGDGGGMGEPQALAFGADAYLAKPLKMDDFERRIAGFMQVGGGE